MKRMKFIAGILLVFILGVLAGAAGTGIIVKHRVDGFRERGPVKRDHYLLKKFTNELDLNDGQQAKFQEILDRMRRFRSEFFKKHRDEFQVHIDRSVAEMRAVLTGEQFEKFDEMQEKFKRFRKKGPPPPVD